MTVAAAAAMTWRPVAVAPVKLTMSTPGWATRARPISGPDPVRTLTTPGGMSVSAAISSPRASADQGVSGAALSTTVQPAAKAGASLARLTWTGKL